MKRKWSDLQSGLRDMLVGRGIYQGEWDNMPAGAQEATIRALEEEIDARSAPKAEMPDVGGAFSRFSGRVDALLESGHLVGWQRAGLAVLLLLAAGVVFAVVITLTSGRGGPAQPPVVPPGETTAVPTPVVRATSTPRSEETVVPEATATKAAKAATKTPSPTKTPKPTATPKPITDSSVIAATRLGQDQWVQILGAILLCCLAVGEAFGRMREREKRSDGRKRELLDYLDILAPLVGFVTVVFVSVEIASVGWLVVVAAFLVASVLSGEVDFTPLWAFLSGAGIGFFLTGNSGLYSAIPWFAGMITGNYGVAETIRIISEEKVVPLSGVFHLAMLVAIIGFAVEVIRKTKSAIVLVGVTWPVVYWALRALTMLVPEDSQFAGLGLPVPAFLLAGLLQLVASSVVTNFTGKEGQVSVAGIAVRMDFLFLGAALALWSIIAVL